MNFIYACFIVIIIAIVVFLGCVIKGCYDHTHGVRHGTVYKKEFTPAHTTLIFHSTGKVSWSTPIFHADKYTVWIKDGDKTNYWEVTPLEYDRIQEGQEFKHDD